MHKEISDGSAPGRAFKFTLTNTKNKAIKYTITTNASTGDSAATKVYVGTYTLEEDEADAKNGGFTSLSKPVTISVTKARTASSPYSVTWKNEKIPNNPYLTISKVNLDGSSNEGFTFRITCSAFDSVELTEQKMLEHAGIDVSYDKDSYDAGSWSVNKEDLKKINDNAKAGTAGTFDVRLTNHLTYKQKEATPAPQAAAAKEAAADAVSSEDASASISNAENTSADNTESGDEKGEDSGEDSDSDRAQDAAADADTAPDAQSDTNDAADDLDSSAKNDTSDSKDNADDAPVPEDMDLEITMKVTLKNVTDDKGKAVTASAPTPATKELRNNVTISYNKAADFVGAASLYRDKTTGNPYTMVTMTGAKSYTTLTRMI